MENDTTWFNLESCAFFSVFEQQFDGVHSRKKQLIFALFFPSSFFISSSSSSLSRQQTIRLVTLPQALWIDLCLSFGRSFFLLTLLFLPFLDWLTVRIIVCWRGISVSALPKFMFFFDLQRFLKTGTDKYVSV